MSAEHFIFEPFPIIRLAITFVQTWALIDPRASEPQSVTFCVVRSLAKGPIQTSYGCAVRNPSDGVDFRIGREVALTRALSDILWKLHLSNKEYRRIARRALWEADGKNKQRG